MDKEALYTLDEATRAEMLDALQNPPEDPIKTLASALDLLITKFEEHQSQFFELDAKVSKLQQFIDVDLIGGVTSLAEAQEKLKRISGLKEKYGASFAPHESFIKGMVKDGDPENLWGDLDEHLSGLSGSEGYDEDSTVKALAEAIGKRVAELTGKTEEKPAEEAAPSVEAAAPEEEPDPMSGVIDMIKRLRSHGDIVA